MKAQDIPFNIELLLVRSEGLKGLTPVTSLDIFEPSSKNFHKEGLFSTEIFGKVGNEIRNRMFSYIDMRATILHPTIFKALSDMREFYVDILACRKYALWNPKLKDFEESDIVNGFTGMQYFLKHFEEIQFEDRPSTKRQFNIRLIDKYRKNPTMRYLLVLPAGLRDYEILESGKPEEGEVNPLYRKVINLSNLISPELFKINPDSVNTVRFNLQMAVVDIYNYFKSLLEGKSKFINSKWAARKVFYSTRNVISTITNDAPHADDPNILKFNETAVGLFQHTKAIVPLSLNQIRTKHLMSVFPGPNTPAVLVNKKTLHRENVQVDPQHYDDWMSNEGLNNVLNRFGSRELRHEILEIENYYLGLIYKGPDMTFRFLQDIDDVPEGFSKEHVYPITFAELLYISVYEDANKIPGFFSRYPISGYGSIYPSFTHLKTTQPAEVRIELDEQWAHKPGKAYQFPIRGMDFFDTLACHQSHIGRLGADYDGDVCSWTALVTQEAQQEVADKLNSPGYYIDANGKMYFSGETDTIKLALAYMTR